jgi:glutathione S-transferase
MLAELGIDYTAKLIGPRTGETRSVEFRALNPKEKIPVLVDDDFVLTESAAIVTWLGDAHGAGSGLVPGPGSRERARYDEWLSYVQMELDAHTLYVIRKHRDLSALYGEAPAAIAAAEAGFLKQVGVAAGRLAQYDYLIGDRFTAADIMLESCLGWARHCGIELAASLEAYSERLATRPAFARAARLNFSIGTATSEQA